MQLNQDNIKGYQRSFLVKEAHSLKPIVYVGKNGITPSLIEAVNESLDHHELIKIKFVDYKASRREVAAEIEEQTHSLVVKIIGNIAILYRPNEDKEKRSIHVPGESTI